jgi:inosose dehydratase
VAEETGLRTLYHHHCAAWVETPDEIARFLDAPIPPIVDLVFDTGHYTYGTGVPRRRRPAALARACGASGAASPTCTSRTATPGWRPAPAPRAGTTPSVGEGVFCELGQGSVDLAGVLAFLRAAGYADWVTVEQDVLPGMGTPRESARATARAARLGL